MDRHVCRRCVLCLLLPLLAPPGVRGDDLLAGTQWDLLRLAEGDATMTRVPAQRSPGGRPTAWRIALENRGPDPEIQVARGPVRPEQIQARIQSYRTGTLIITVHHRDGRPVPHAVVRVEQTRHAFLVGCNIFNLQPDNEEPWQQAYQKRFTELLNYATLPFYWGAFEPQPGKPQYARLDRMARWCRDHGLALKGHPLVWHEVYPGWAPRSADAAIPLLKQRVTDLITHYRDLISYWDVLNEAKAAGAYANGEEAWIKRDGPASVVATALAWAREASWGTHNTLFYNDFDTTEKNVVLLRQLQARHALPDAIGIQSHMHGGNWPLERVWQVADRFARFGRPLHFTEVTVLSGPWWNNLDPHHPPGDWVTTAEGEAEQAAYLKQLYSVLFSHPAVRAITYWDLSDRGAWQNAPAGLLRADMSPKPAYLRLMALSHGRWWTRAEGRTDPRGRYQTRAFCGDYRVSVTDGQNRTVEHSVSLPMACGEKRITVVLPR